MDTLLVLEKLTALVSRAPASSDDTDRSIAHVLEAIKYLFDAYLVDFVWERNQGKNVELHVVQTLEQEKHGYKKLRVYVDSDDNPDSLTAWCYLHGKPVWLVDPDGLKKGNEYPNIYHNKSDDVIPPNTIYEYNKKPIRTEICVPLHNSMSKDWRRASGVLNIESQLVVRPSNKAREVLDTTARVLELLQNRRIAVESAEEWSKREYDIIHQLSKAIEGSQFPRIKPRAFLVSPWGLTGVRNIMLWVEKFLTEKGIIVRTDGHTNENIRESMLNELKASNFGVVITTGFNRNALFEFGVLVGAGKPVIRLHQEEGGGVVDPFDIENDQRHAYAVPGEAPTEEGVRKVLEIAFERLKADKRMGGVIDD